MKARGMMIYAKDVGRMTAFYRDVLGLRVTSESPEWVELDAGNVLLALHAIPADYAARIVIASPPKPRWDTALKVLFEVDDLAAVRARLRGAGAELPSRHEGEGEVSSVDAIDPEGNVFGVSRRARRA